MQATIIANKQSQNRHSQMNNKYKTKQNKHKKTKKEKQTNTKKYKEQQNKHTKKRERKNNTQSTFMVGAVRSLAVNSTINQVA